MSHACPNCGYCPHCGRANPVPIRPAPVQPWPCRSIPWWQRSPNTWPGGLAPHTTPYRTGDFPLSAPQTTC